jgi:HAMP domain-containing protein
MTKGAIALIGLVIFGFCYVAIAVWLDHRATRRAQRELGRLMSAVARCEAKDRNRQNWISTSR